MQDWIDAVCAALEIEASVDIDTILDVAKHAAHQVERPAAPITTYLLGIAVAQGIDPGVAAQRIEDLAGDWSG
jgi:hypothetical protein